MIRNRFYLSDAGRPTPSLQRKGQVHAHVENLNAGQLPRFLVEAVHLRITNRGINRRGNADEERLALERRESHRREILREHFELRRSCTHFNLRTNERQRIAFERHGSFTFLR